MKNLKEIANFKLEETLPVGQMFEMGIKRYKIPGEQIFLAEYDTLNDKPLHIKNAFQVVWKEKQITGAFIVSYELLEMHSALSFIRGEIQRQKQKLGIKSSVNNISLLEKYIAHVIDCEGFDFILDGNIDHHMSDQQFTPEEKETLINLANKIISNR